MDVNPENKAKRMLIRGDRQRPGASGRRPHAGGGAAEQHLLPFATRFTLVQGMRCHYSDVGQGAPVVMLHGNPTWMFYYRNLILALKGQYRCIALDHIGCGQSEKPAAGEYPFTLERRVADFETFVDGLGLSEPFHLVMHDWGGMIGTAFAARHPERVRSLVAMNTAAFPMPPTKRLPLALTLGRTSLGQHLIKRHNAFVRAANRVCTKRDLPAHVKRGYSAPFARAQDREAVAEFVRDIPLGPGDRSWSTLTGIEKLLPRLQRHPLLLLWGLGDFVFDGSILAEWRRRFPQAQVHALPGAGHYVLEDAATEAEAAIRNFLAHVR